jgi:putative ABC transport system permease protein
MRSVRRFWRRLRETLRPWHRDDEFVEEVETHIRMLTEDNLRSGMRPNEAHRAALLRFGSVDATAESWRGQRRLPFIETIARDVRFAIRGLRKEPGFTAVSVLTLALGIGANTAIFTVVNAVLIQPLPYPDAHQLVQVWETNPQANRWGDWASYPDFEDWRRDTTTLEAMAAFRYGRLRLTDGEYPEMLVSVRGTPDLFSVLRVSPMLGRAFLPDEGSAGRSDVAVLSYGLWQRRFGSEPTVVGRRISIDGGTYLVVGVMPPGFDFPTNIQPSAKPPDLWVPLTPDRSRGSHNYRVIARLKRDRTIEQAQADMNRLMRSVAEVDPSHRGRGSAVEGLQQHAVTTVRPALLFLMGATVLVLLIACANVANLLLARGVSRQKEMAIRLALGATPARVLQQGLTESVVLALAGCAAGLVVAVGGIRLLVDLAPALPLVSGVSVDGRVLAFTIIIALATGIAFGLLPTLRALRVQANDVLKEAGVRNAGSLGRSRARTVLTVAEVALAVILMIGAGLLIRSFVGVRNVDVGFDPRNLATAILSAPPTASSDADRVTAFFQDVIARAEQVPGVARVAGASAVPFISNESSPFRVEAALQSTGGDVYAEQPKISPAYFRAMGIRLLAGREFDRTDVRRSEPVAIVSKGLADTYWPREEAIGKRLQVDDRQWRRIVGVVQDVRHDGFDQPVRPTIYIPFAQYPRSTMTLLIRSHSDPLGVVGAIRESARSVDRNQPLFGIQTMEQTLSASLSTRRFLVILSVIFASVAVALGTVGVYGVLAYLVGQRRQELAIRAALGATTSEVIGLVLKHGLLLGSLGVGLGLLGSLALSRIVSGLLFGVSPTDPWTFAAVPTLLIGIVLTASYVSARAAARVNPSSALRGE